MTGPTPPQAADSDTPSLPRLDLPPDSPYSARAIATEEAFADMIDDGELDDLIFGEGQP